MDNCSSDEVNSDTESYDRSRNVNEYLAVSENNEASGAIQRLMEIETEVKSKRLTPLDMIDELLRKQKIYFDVFDKYTTNINFDELESKWEIELNLQKVERRWKTIEDIHCDLDGIAGEEYQNTFEKYKQAYAQIRKTLDGKLLALTHRHRPIEIEYELPTFSGDYLEYSRFKILFKRIHEHPDLTDKFKMLYLKMALKGEAEMAIQYIPIGEGENYQECWDVLNKRYDNKEYLCRHYLNVLFEIPPVQEPSKTLQDLINKARQSVYGLKSAGIDISTWDPILIYILTSKLDRQTHQDYRMATCMKYKSNELPKLDDLMDFLQKQSNILFWNDEIKRNNNKHQHQKKNYRRFKPRNNYQQ